MYRVRADNGLDVDKNGREVDQCEKPASPRDLGLNVDAAVRSELFPPRGPIRACEFGPHASSR